MTNPTNAHDWPPANSTTACPKCGSQNLRRLYREKDKSDVGIGFDFGTPQRLVIHCQRCHWEGRERCADDE